jgi:uncharacterized membrane protein YvbJ
MKYCPYCNTSYTLKEIRCPSCNAVNYKISTGNGAEQAKAESNRSEIGETLNFIAKGLLPSVFILVFFLFLLNFLIYLRTRGSIFLS